MASADIVVDVWFADYPFRTYQGTSFLQPLRDQAAAFEQRHPGCRISVRGVDFWDMAQEVSEAVEQGRAPDVAGYYASDTRMALDTRTPDGRPRYVSVTEALAGRDRVLGEAVVLDDLEPAVRSYYTRSGELLCVPLSATTTVLYSNLTLLRLAGIAEPPRTWRELRTACEAVRALPGGHATGATWANHGWLFQQAVAQQGGLLADHDNGRAGTARTVDLASAAMLAWVSWWRQLHADGLFHYSGTPDDWEGCFGAFAGQQVAFLISSSKSAEELVGAGREAGFEVAVSAMPHNDDVPYAGNFVSGDALWLADGPNRVKRDHALAFVLSLLQPSAVAAWHRSNGFLPVTGAGQRLLEAEGWFARHPHHRAAVEQLRRSDGSPAALGPIIGRLTRIDDVLAAAMHDVLVHDADPAQRFAAATATAQQIVDDHIRVLSTTA
ncbi:extracellular solute-binding protein [Micromonospora sp. KC723]|uniref:extracellular solute-binding protein n=1 Tax=Micromonospora sp. KC723 TaxID=2530381 RepID=UPI00140527F7|nr:extracellular solute-binding protein [Micromonospora sp. KC723]